MRQRLTAILALDMAGFSRLMERDEAGVLARHAEHRGALIDPAVGASKGRIVKATGDGIIAEYPSAADAVRCAVTVQLAMAAREAGTDPNERIRYRIGVNLGDVMEDDTGDLFGDCVNIAARIEGIAEPGGVAVTDPVHEAVMDRLGATFRDMGRQRVKHISRPIRVWQWTPTPVPPAPDLPAAASQQRVQFAVAPDGTTVAWAAVGSGRPVLKAPNWMNHVEYEWRSPVWGPFLAAMAERCRLVRFDQRGTGLSDWEPAAISEDAMVRDMETVARTAGLDRCALLGISQGCYFSVRYTVEHPGEITAMVLYGGYVRGRLKRATPDDLRLHEALTVAIRDGWGSPNPVFRHLFTSCFVPEAPAFAHASFDELQRVAVSPENALRIWHMNACIDGTDLLPQIRVPTLVLHCRGDRVVPIEEGRRMARLIPGSEFVELPGDNHAVLAGTPAFDALLEETGSFLERHNR